MKNLLLSLSLATLSLLAVGCKNSDVNPDVASEVTGTYVVVYLAGNGNALTLPTATTKAGVTLTKASNTDIDLVLGVTIGTVQDITDPVRYQVRRNGSSYEMVQNNRKVGTMEQDKLKLDVTKPDGTITYFEAVRR